MREIQSLNYFDRVVQHCIVDNYLMPLLDIVEDEEIKIFLFNIIDSYNYDLTRGLPMGNQTSQCFSLLYLNKLDRLIKEKYKCKYYSRYMDDGIVLHHDKEYLKEMLFELEIYLNNELKMEFNNKTNIKRMRLFKYLGFNYSYNENGKILKLLSSKRKSLILKKVKRSKSINTITSYKGYFLNSNNYYFYERILNKIN